MIGDPARAPIRTDLPFLRRRYRPRAANTQAASSGRPRAANTQAASSGRPAGSPLGDFLSGHGAHEPHREPAPAAPPPSISFERPDRRAAPVPSGSLDLSTPATAAAAAAALPVTRPSGSLDLSTAATAAPAAAAVRVARPSAAVRRPTVRAPRGARIRPGEQQLLDFRNPTVVLTRVQSGVGQLEVEAAVSPAAGDFRLGAAYELTSGITSTVQLAGGNRFAPSSRRPVIVAGRDEYDHLRVDLRQVRDVRRLAVYAFSESRTDLEWSGTVVVTTSGGGRAEVPLEPLYRGRVAVLLSIYQLDGELVVRAEMQTIAGDVREAARAYGFDRIAWRDDRLPID